MAKNSKTTTPLMQQYNAIKSKHPEALLLFRVGDFYETFGSDAEETAKLLGIILTQRNNGGDQTPLAGFPHHALNTYLPKLVRAGKRVAICDQLEDAKQVKGIVKRGVTELITPGLTTADELLEAKRNNFLGALYKADESYALALLDLSTGDFKVAEGNADYIESLLTQFDAAEVILPKSQRQQLSERFELPNPFNLEDWVFENRFAFDLLIDHFQTASLDGFGLHSSAKSIGVSGALLHYLNETQHHQKAHIRSVTRLDRKQHLWMDAFTIKSLELFHALHPGGRSLLSVIDLTQTPMGARTLRQWIARPLTQIESIVKRHETVAFFNEQKLLRQSLRDELKSVNDLERLSMRIATRRIGPKELKGLEKTLQHCLNIESKLAQTPIALAVNKAAIDEAKTTISLTLNEEVPAVLAKGGVIANKVHDELDALRKLAFQSEEALNELLSQEIKETGISSMKIDSNSVFGYYFEVRNTHKDKVPPHYVRKQTLVNAERYVTEELKAFEQKIEEAKQRIGLLEFELYTQLLDRLQPHIGAIQQLAEAIAALDCLVSFSVLAEQNNYVRPLIDDQSPLLLKAARHPVIERLLESKQAYIANDVQLDTEQQQIMMITGPNMSGKSALLRQTALCVILAQAGSFIPAQSAQMGIVDKLFTRVGASDNISAGASTFMVEMNETAAILNNLSDRSLVLMDEIGRGTSTYDGISLAWAIAAYLHNHPMRPKTLFATHYHELSGMSDQYQRIKNYNVAVKESGDKVVFLRTLKPGGSEHSFGLYVAKLAGMPQTVIQKAEQLLKTLESSGAREGHREKMSDSASDLQLSFIQLEDPVLLEIKDELADLDIDHLTPVEALMKLQEIKNKLGKL
ncbi:MAG: DNA mismatch repair protein MutS [Flavobacteriaceae bacterium]